MLGERPHFDKEIYVNWLVTNKGTPEQKERWRASVAWYDQAQKPQHPQLSLDDVAQDGKVVIYVGLGNSARARHGGAWRLWTYSKMLPGSGAIKADDLRDYAAEKGISSRKYQRWLNRAIEIGLFRVARQGSVLLPVNPWKAAVILGCNDPGERALVDPDMLAGKDWRDAVWAATLLVYHQKTRKDKKLIHDKQTDKVREVVNDVIYWSPASRETLTRLTGVPEYKQREMEKRLPVKYFKNYKMTGIQGDAIGVYQKQTGIGNSFITKVKGGGSFIAIRLPDARKVCGDFVEPYVKQDRPSNGHAQPITERTTGKQSAACASRSYRSRGRLGTAGNDAMRLFYESQKAAERKARRLGAKDITGVEDVYYRVKRTRKKYVNWWESEEVNLVL